MREAGRRVLQMRHYDVQMIGGMVLHSGTLAEMKTGEGKTLVATLPAYLNALAGKGVHIVTVNDYLARRDSEWMGRVYRFLGMSVGVIQHDLNDQQRQVAYNCDITYGTNNEFGFDYLRDNMKFDVAAMVQRGHHYAIVDEVDSILIDEARTPLIISGPAEESTDLYYEVDRIIPKLKRGEVHQGQVKGEDRDRLEASGDFVVDEKNKTATLTESGMAKAEQLLAHRLQPGGLYDPANMPLLHHVQQALRAHVHYQLDVQYMIKDGQVVIVDEFTGRLMPGRRWSDGLAPGRRSQGRRQDRAREPDARDHHLPELLPQVQEAGRHDRHRRNRSRGIRQDLQPRRHRHSDQSRDGAHRGTRPRLSHRRRKVGGDRRRHHQDHGARPPGARRHGLDRKVRACLEHAQEEGHEAHRAQREVSRAGSGNRRAGRPQGRITIATNMAGRGTDILLGGNPEYMARQQSLNEEVAEKVAKGEEYIDDDEYVNFFHVDAFYRVKRADWDRIFTHFKRQCEEEHKEVVNVGGLHIIGTERHEARRIDNQLRGRAGRQGDPGSSRFFLSLEDDLMRIFGSDRISGLMQRLGMEEGVPIEHGMVSRAIERAQKQVEAQNFAVRKHLLEYDDVMNKQRESVYTLRREILEGKIHLSEEEVSDERGYLLATAEELFDDRSISTSARTSKRNGICRRSAAS